MDQSRADRGALQRRDLAAFRAADARVPAMQSLAATVGDEFQGAWPAT